MSEAVGAAAVGRERPVARPAQAEPAATTVVFLLFAFLHYYQKCLKIGHDPSKPSTPSHYDKTWTLNRA